MALIDLQYKGLTGTLGSLTDFDDTATIDDLIATISADEGLDTNFYQISKEGDPANTLSIIYGDSSASVASLGIVDGDRIICTANQSGTKEERQKQKLDISAAKRGETYDRDLLPTKYVGNEVVDNPNAAGLLKGRPWITYSVVPRSLVIDEGLANGTAFDIYTTGVPDGTTLYFTVTGTVTGADFDGGVLPSGSTVVNNNVSAVSFGLIADGLTEGTETYALQIRTGSTSGPVVATSALVTVNDTST